MALTTRLPSRSTGWAPGTVLETPDSLIPVCGTDSHDLSDWLLNSHSPYVMGPPDFDGAVLGSRIQKAISSPAEAGDRLCVSGEDAFTAACSRVPDSYTAVFGAAGHIAALRVPGEGGNVTSGLTWQCLFAHAVSHS